MKYVIVLTGIIILSLSACGHKAEEKPTGVLTEAQEKTLEKAHQLDDVAKKTEEERLKVLNDTEGKSSTSE